MFWNEVRNRSRMSTEMWLGGHDELLICAGDKVREPPPVAIQ
jgi:hypothetical protein